MKPTSIEIINILKKAGHEAFWAGGCVRDMLLGIEPKDFDIATSAKPMDIKKLFKKTIPVGEKYGVVMMKRNEHHFEIATFRSDSGYSDGRRPDAVIFTNAEEDAKRRDFTINALFYDPTEDKIYDYVGGQKDLDAKLIRFIGDPHERILEDHLRIIRAIRFKNTFGFQYHPETFEAIKKHAKLITKISKERIRDELNKMIMHPSFADALEDMEDTGILKEILPEVQMLKGVPQPLEYHTEGDVFDHMLLSVRATSPDTSLMLRWAIFLHDVGKPETFKVAERIRYDHHAEKSAEIAKTIMRRLKFSTKEIDQATWLIGHHMMVGNVLDMPVSRRRHWFLQPWFLELVELNRCDAAGTIPPKGKKETSNMHDQVLALYRKDLKEMPKEPPRLITGNDIMKILKIQPGKEIQKVLDEIRELQLAKKIMNKKQALEWLKEQTK